MSEPPPEPDDLTAPGEDQPSDEVPVEPPRSRPYAPTPPIPLDYGKPQRSGLPQPGGGTAENVSLGCVYALLAGVVSFGLIRGLGPTLGDWYFVIPLMLLGVPIVLALSFRGWRYFALGILLAVGLALLIFGTCIAIVFHGGRI